MKDKDLHEEVGRLTEAMLADLKGVEIPDEAITVADVARESGLTVIVARARLDELIRVGKWTKAKRGNTMYYWKT